VVSVAQFTVGPRRVVDHFCMSMPGKMAQSGLTSRQTDAVAHVSGNLQLIACAGSGKTEVVAQRVVTLLRPVNEGGAGCEPRHIVAFTFTEKAAAELKERIHARCQEQLGTTMGLADLYVGTIHGYCLDLLKSEVAEYLKFEVLNEVQLSLFVDRHSKASGLTQSSTLDGTPLKRYTDTRNYIAALGILREDEVQNPDLLKGNSVQKIVHYMSRCCTARATWTIPAYLQRRLNNSAEMMDCGSDLLHVFATSSWTNTKM
jgi:ATP-dependent DNA helicase UvrD/PcrA